MLMSGLLVTEPGYARILRAGVVSLQMLMSGLLVKTRNTNPDSRKMAGRKMKTRHGLIAILLPAIVLHPGIGLVCDPDIENVF
jgi:hypothetical protein